MIYGCVVVVAVATTTAAAAFYDTLLTYNKRFISIRSVSLDLHLSPFIPYILRTKPLNIYINSLAKKIVKLIKCINTSSMRQFHKDFFGLSSSVSQLYYICYIKNLLF